MKHKLLVFALALTLLLPCFGGSVAYALDEYTDITSYVEDICDVFQDGYSMPSLDDYKYQMIYIYNDTYNLYCSDVPLFLSSGNLKNTSKPFGYVWFYFDGTQWKHHNSDTDATITSMIFDSFYVSSYDIYNSSSELVFQKPSEPLGIPGEILTQAVTLETPLKEILVILPMVIVCLVGYVGLRKALATLRATLKKA